MTDASPTIWTIGHSTRSAEEFRELLEVNGIEALADVRRHAGSRKYPHFNPDALRDSLAEISVDYMPMPDLGGRRRARPDSRNTIWRNASFRGYADYMETEEFGAAIERLQALAARRRTVIMCAEAVWWRCHRALIADHLKATGWCVQHIMSKKRASIHPYTSAARIADERLSYAPDESEEERGRGD
jgi:uncharacterized protein (DUF488 family)